MKKVTLIIAFKTRAKYNRLTELKKFKLVEKLTQALGGVTLVENFGGYTGEDGKLSIEYSYTMEFFDVKKSQVKEIAQALAVKNKQESYIINGDFIYTTEEA